MNLLKILKLLFGFFFKKPVLTHPQEPINKYPTLDIGVDRSAWLANWSVPAEYWGYWITRQTQITGMVGFADTTSELTRFNPYWISAGVIAHEFAHRSYFLLSDIERVNFSIVYNKLKDTDPLIRLLYSQNTYGLTSDIEGHAEVYRYIGDKMPEELKGYYPKLL